MAAKKGARSTRGNKRKPKMPTRAQKKLVLDALGAIKSDAQDTQVQVKRIRDILIRVDFHH
jgi:hypothetical protein